MIGSGGEARNEGALQKTVYDFYLCYYGAVW